jgi:hypothetical protein
MTSWLSWTLIGYGKSVKRVTYNIASVYVLFALAFAFTEVGDHRATVGRVLGGDPGPVAPALREGLYFSAITFTTVGYGGIAPTTAVGRQLAMAEAFLGTVLIVLLGVVLGNREVL